MDDAVDSNCRRTIAPVEIFSLTSKDFDRWDEFVRRSPEGTFFHLARWKVVLERVFGHRTHYLFAQRNHDIVGVLPLAEVKSRLFGHSLISTPFCVYGGIVTAGDADAEVVLDATAQHLAAKLRVQHLEYRGFRLMHPGWPRSDLYFTFRKSIEPDPATNMAAIPRKQRAVVRKGIKSGLSSEIDTGIERFFLLYADNARRHGTPALPRSYFQTLREIFRQDCEVLVVIDNGIPISAVLTFYFRDEVLPYYAGDLPVARDCGANDFKYWELMRRAAERGYRVFDFGRSKRGTGSFNFKKNWGFSPAPLAYEYRLVRGTKVPNLNPLNPKYRLLISAWKHLPLPVANSLGPRIVKFLG